MEHVMKCNKILTGIAFVLFIMIGMIALSLVGGGATIPTTSSRIVFIPARVSSYDHGQSEGKIPHIMISNKEIRKMRNRAQKRKRKPKK